MRKFTALISTIILGLVFSTAFAASDTAAHNVRVEIPAIAMIRITSSNSGNSAASNPTIVFNFLNDAAYQALDGSTLTTFAASNTNDFGTLEVLSNTSWTLSVQAGETATDSGGNDISGTSSLQKASVLVVPNPTGLDTSISSPPTQFGLDTNGDIANGTKTTGWKSVGIDASSYKVDLDGTETPGTYVFDVTYTITAP